MMICKKNQSRKVKNLKIINNHLLNRATNTVTSLLSKNLLKSLKSTVK